MYIKFTHTHDLYSYSYWCVFRIICGLTQFTTKAHIARATLEAVCFQNREVSSPQFYMKLAAFIYCACTVHKTRFVR